MTDTARPPMSARQPPWDWAEAVSDADPAEHGVYEMGNGDLVHYVPPGSLHAQLASAAQAPPLPRGKSEGTEADSNSRQYGSFGASNQPSIHNKVSK